MATEPRARLGALVRARAYVAACAALLCAACAVTPPEEDPVQIKMNDIDTRLGKVERVVTNQSLLELSQRIDQLQNEVRGLRGQVEELEHANESLRKQQRDLYGDIDRRLAATVASPVATPGVTAPSGAAPAVAAAPEAAPAQAAYGRAFDALKAGNYAAAIQGFNAFLAAHPRHELADNAQYWLGEAYYVSRDFDKALESFRALGERWPDSRKAADALLKLGYAQFELKRLPAARATLQSVIERYPGSEAARLAADRLQRIAADAR